MQGFSWLTAAKLQNLPRLSHLKHCPVQPDTALANLCITGISGR
jgi:hypothetical protein